MLGRFVTRFQSYYNPVYLLHVRFRRLAKNRLANRSSKISGRGGRISTSEIHNDSRKRLVEQSCSIQITNCSMSLAIEEEKLVLRRFPWFFFDVSRFSNTAVPNLWIATFRERNGYVLRIHVIILLVEDFPFSFIQTFRMLTAIDKCCRGIYSVILGLEYMLVDKNSRTLCVSSNWRI